MRASFLAVAIAVVLLGGSAAKAETITITHGSATIAMDFVLIGNPGNLADTTTYGAVGYEYRIGTYAVSANQWAAAKAVDTGIGTATRWSGNQPASNTAGAEAWNNAARFANWLTTGSANLGYYSTGTTYTASPTHGQTHQQYADLNGTTYFVPTENEWYKAAYYDPNKPGGAGYYSWATGSNTKPTAVFSGTSANTAVFNNGTTIPTAPAFVDQSGGLSPYGTMGQGGNVFEFNEGNWTPSSLSTANRGRRGGYWGESGFMQNTNQGAMNGVSTTGSASQAERQGFRVTQIAPVPEPGTVTMLIVAAAGLLVFTRRRSGQPKLSSGAGRIPARR